MTILTRQGVHDGDARGTLGGQSVEGKAFRRIDILDRIEYQGTVPLYDAQAIALRAMIDAGDAITFTGPLVDRKEIRIGTIAVRVQLTIGAMRPIALITSIGLPTFDDATE